MKQLLFNLILFAFLSTYILAQGDLTGLKYIVVDVSLDKELKDFNVESIKTDIELKLRLTNINVIDIDQYITKMDNKFADLIATIDVVVFEDRYGFTIRLSIKETLLHPRLNNDYYSAITWQGTQFGVTAGVGYRGWQFIREAVKEVTDNFLNDYLSDNPKN